MSPPSLTPEMRREPPLLRQTLVLFWKNVLHKWRRKWQTLLEWMQNLAFVLLMFLVAAATQSSSHSRPSPAVPLGRLGEYSGSNVSVGYVGTAPPARDIMERIRHTGIGVQEYANEEEVLEGIYNDTTLGLVLRDPLTYHIQSQIQELGSPNDYLAYHGVCDNGSTTSCTPTRYWHSGFLFLQMSIDSAIIEMSTGKSVRDTMGSIQVVRMGVARSVWRNMVHTGIFISSMCMCYVSLTYLLSQYISRERGHMREIMRMMRLKDLAFWWSWGLLYTLYILIIANLMTLVVKTYVFFESSYGVILVLFILYGLASVSFTFMLSALFRNPRVTAIVGFFITLFLSLFGLLLLMKNLPKAVEVLLSIFPPFAFAVGLTESVHLEDDMQGVFFMDMAGNSSHVLSSCISLTLDTIFYTILTLYFDRVLPDKYGVRHEPFFFLKSSFWYPQKTLSSREEDLHWEDHIERPPRAFREAIRIRDIQKSYSAGDRKLDALRGLTFDIYEGQITALLGHSGAGKTTLLNILSGICPPTSGSASIYGHSVSHGGPLPHIGGGVALCPQYDVNFGPLTVKENLMVFAKIQGIQSEEVRRVMSQLHLSDMEDEEAETLSGGQKRRLSVGIAMLGDPQVLLLDEPTAGLDPASRHQLWAVLQRRKGEQVTLLSTHTMEEADILADRKAVISAGRLKCLGSSLFLKRKWGIGYHLKMQTAPSCDPDTLTSLMQQHISSATLSATKGEELIFTLPFPSMDTFPDLFSHLEDRVGRDILSYGVSMTTLDDVFLKLEGDAEVEQADYGVFGPEVTTEEDGDPSSSDMEDSIRLMADSGQATLSGLALWRRQTLAVARIRFLKLKHSMKSFRAILLLLLLCLVPAIIFFSVMRNLKTIHSWELKPDLYFLGPRDKEHKYYSRLLICNNTGSPIEDFADAVAFQDILIDVTDGPYDRNTTLYRGAIEVSRGAEGYGYSIIGSPRAMNALPVLLNIISNAQLKMAESSKRIRIWSDPVINFSQEGEGPMMFYVSIGFMVFITGMAPHIAMSSIEDTKMKARSQLHICGLFPSAYWCGQALVDIPSYWLVLFLLIAVQFLMNHTVVLDPGTAFVLIFGILGYGVTMVLYVYVIAFILRNSKGHPDWWSFFFIMTSSVNVFVADVAERYVPWHAITWPFIFPPSSLPILLMEISYYENLKLYPEAEKNKDLLPILSIPYIQILLFWGALWGLEWKWGRRSDSRDPVFRTLKHKMRIKPNPEDVSDSDEDVLAERERVRLSRCGDHQEEKPVIIVDNLRKEFLVNRRVLSCQKKKKRVATKSVSFCVGKGEVLGLLGPNGAGKTTSIFMLARELEPSAGEVEVCEESPALMGYCSQDSCLWPDVTVQEHLEVYTAIRGLETGDGGLAIQRVSEALELSDHLGKAARTLSAGVSRKVCFAISMLGNPTIVLLDEPSTGLDPKGRQRVWRAIRAAFRNKDRGAIVTTHYMEEAEAVCDRIAIMVSGRLRCIGSVQHLKTKFGKGYLLEMKVKDSQSTELLQQQIIRMFPQAVQQDRFSSLLVYKVPMEDVQSLSQAFLQLEEAKRAFNVEEYSFSQTTLEQVFLDLVKEQEKDDFHVEKTFRWGQLQSDGV